MSARPPGRRTESLFDNRYRYDHIYPRGRSGETLRAYDTYDNDRPVVIKRPAPQDAPPMRAGQEVSIRVERQALERLSGHPVLTELRGSGTFRVGGHTHDYIVMDRAFGETVENLVLESAQRGQYLPELETLVIVDALLDLLSFAHEKQVIYNDVDAKHLFWSRENYTLKVIDWGNAVFPDEPGSLPTVSRATDIYQVGELLYFITTGGNRLDVSGENDESFYVNFGLHAERIPPRLQAIITRAVHPDLKRRYRTIAELRHALTDYRAPLEKTRSDIISRVRKRVRATASHEELEALGAELADALVMDTGHPEARELANQITYFQQQIAIQADLDAIRIYLESENWPRALSLLHDLLPRAQPESEPIIRFLITAATEIQSARLTPAPAGFLAAIDPLFAGDLTNTGRTLLITPERRSTARRVQWLLAERLSTLVSDVILLRPHLTRLRAILEGQTGAQKLLDSVEEVDSQLDAPPAPGLTGLVMIYERSCEMLSRLGEPLGHMRGNIAVEAQEEALASAARARRAAQRMTDLLEQVGHNVYGDASKAGDLLHRAQLIDPTSPHFDDLHDYFDEVHQAVSALAQFRPQQSGSNLATWFADVQDFLIPYLEDLPDRRLHEAANGLQQAGTKWTITLNYIALGRREPSVDLLRDTAGTIRPYNPNIAAWLGNLATRLPDAPFVEQFSPNQELANTLIAGWQAWDQGDAIRASQLGHKALEKAGTDGERLAADRLRRLSELFDDWLAEGHYQSADNNDQTEMRVLDVLLTEEEQERRMFAEQMPSTGVYLRTMKRGLIAYMMQSSSAGWRALYFHYVLRGMLALLSDDFEATDFWREAALNSWEKARTHRAFQIFDRALTTQHLLSSAQKAMNAVRAPADLDTVRQALNVPLAGEVLTGAEQAVRDIHDALKEWSDGNFHTARQNLATARSALERACEKSGLQIDPFMEWLTKLHDEAEHLQDARLTIDKGAVTTREEPDPAILAAHEEIVNRTLTVLGSGHIHQVRQWHDTYESMLEIYTTQRLTREEKLAAFDRHFASLFINKHPAYPLYRHWEAITTQLPIDDEDEVISLDKAHHESSPDGDARGAGGIAFVDDSDEVQGGESERDAPEAEAATAQSGGLPWNWIIIIALLILAGAVGSAILRLDDESPSDNNGNNGSPAAGGPANMVGDGQQPLQTMDSPAGAIVSGASETPTPTRTTAPTASPTREATATATSTDTPEPPTPTATTPLTPSITPTLFVTSTLLPSDTPPPAATETPIPATPAPDTPAPDTPAAATAATDSEALSPAGDLLAALTRLDPDQRTWLDNTLVEEDDEWQLVTDRSSDDTVTLSLGPDVLSALFQPGAANTVVSADATMTLVDYSEADMQAGRVSFGLGAENAFEQQTIAQVQFSDANFANLGLNQNGQFRSRTALPLQSDQIKLSIRRTDPTTLSFFVDDKLLGDSVALFVEGEPVTLLLFASGEDVVVEISSFTIDYSPRSELP